MSRKRSKPEENPEDFGLATLSIMNEACDFLNKHHPDTDLAKAWKLYYESRDSREAESEFIALCKKQAWWYEN